jgi:hypothetical protein
VPPGESVRVGDRQISGGMIYVGKALRSAGGWSEIEPSLINPNLTASAGRPRPEQYMLGYSSSYSWLQPQNRGVYLDWLAQGRSSPDISIGYVLLFFYGIERRVLVDAEHSERARAEIPLLMAEIERLLEIYGDSWFRSHARALLDLYRFREKVCFGDLRPSFERYASIELRLALGKLAAEKSPLPPAWALSWLLCWNEFRRQPAFRDREELRQLFALRYHEEYGEGLRLKPSRARITIDYRPASPGIGHSFTVRPGDLPDVSHLVAPRRKLLDVADEVFHELVPFCRWVSRTGDAESPAALSLLPPDLARLRDNDPSRQLADWVEESVAAGVSAPIQRADLLARWRPSNPDRLTRRDLEMLAVFLERRGYGVEPDVRFGELGNREGTVVFFRLAGHRTDAAIAPGQHYWTAALSLHLAVILAAVDGPIHAAEDTCLLAHVESAAWVDEGERMRLRARLRWLLASPPGLTGLKRRIEQLSPIQRHSIARFLVGVAAADGSVNPEEIRLLSKLYLLLGLDRRTVYSDVHAQAAAGAAAAEPVTLRPAKAGRPGFAIPKAPSRGSSLSLDSRKIDAKLAETETASSLLQEIFIDEGETPPGPAGTIGTLDAAHSALLAELATRPAWDREDVERLAAALGLFPDGALETLNEAAYNLCGAPLLEGDEIIEIETEILEEMLA